MNAFRGSRGRDVAARVGETRRGGIALAVAGALLTAGCVGQGDFGRTPPSAAADRLGLHPNIQVPGFASPYNTQLPLTGEETELRMRAYALTFTYAHNKTYGHWSTFDPIIPQRLLGEGALQAEAYARSITETGYRSPEARLNAIIDDIRADLAQIDQFDAAVRLVYEVDGGRLRDLERLPTAPEAEERVTARVEENRFIVERTLVALGERIAGYEMALGESMLVGGRRDRAAARLELDTIRRRASRLAADIRRLDQRYVLATPPPPDCLNQSLARSC